MKKAGGINFVYFDLGGVFFEWDQAFATAANKFGVDIKRIIGIFNEHDEEITKGYMAPGKFWNVCREKLNIKGGENYNFLESWVGDYVPIEVLHKMARVIAEKYHVGIISNIYKGMYPLLLKRKIVPDLDFKPVILSCEVHLRKPEKEIFKLAQERAGCGVDEILFIDDSTSSVAGAKDFGWKTVLFETYNPDKTIDKVKKRLNLKMSRS
jgi:FMN phosphatase YigB (HAD superfamily)